MDIIWLGKCERIDKHKTYEQSRSMLWGIIDSDRHPLIIQCEAGGKWVFRNYEHYYVNNRRMINYKMTNHSYKCLIPTWTLRNLHDTNSHPGKVWADALEEYSPISLTKLKQDFMMRLMTNS